MEVDLDIENYKLQDILNLFKLNINFNEIDLQKAKKITLKTHPDKSKLPKEYFLFYSKAYKKLFNIYKFRNNNWTTDFDIEYKDIIEEYKNHRDVNKDKKEDTKKFNKWFNKTFEELVDKNNDGYSEWLKEESCEISNKLEKSITNDEKEKIIQEHKTKSRELTIYTETQELNVGYSGNLSSLSTSKPDTYSNSDIFSKNPYEDVKVAYENSLVPVTYEDYKNKKKYNNVLELKSDRKNNDVVMNSSLKEQQEKYLQNKRRLEGEQATHLGWELANEVEKSNKINQEFMSKFNLIKYT